MSEKFNRTLMTAVGNCFHVKVAAQENLITFKNRKYFIDNYNVNYKNLEEQEILQLAEILVEVYKDVRAVDNTKIVFITPPRDLSIDSESSLQFVQTVLKVEGSALHKLFLLSSGIPLVSKYQIDLLIRLAQTKNEAASHLEEIFPHQRDCDDVQNLYILPGTSMITVGVRFGRLDFDSLKREGGSVNDKFKLFLQLRAFLSEASESVTMKEFLKQDLLNSIVTQKPLRDARFITDTYRILTSQYSELALSMNARELECLTIILGEMMYDTDLPEDFLLSRVKSIASGAPIEPYQNISSYLSEIEKKMLISDSDLERLTKAETDIGHSLPRVCYAALAEVISVRGIDKTIEVVRELRNLAEGDGLTFDRDTVMLILEAIKPESDDYPFSWFAQFSDHAWVLTFCEEDEELLLNV